MTAAPLVEPLSNSARFAMRPLTSGGTPAHAWMNWNHPFAELDMTACPGLVIVAPHPDDETLGLGGAAALLRSRGVDVEVVSVSDGGGAHPGCSPFDRRRLELTRRAELRRATSILDVGEPISLGLPDGELADHEQLLTEVLTGILESRTPNIWCAATWRGDGHPDHEAVGRAAAAAAQSSGSVLLEYPVWMWHWATPADPAVPWDRAHTIPLTRAAIERKQLAAQSFRSQFDATAPNSPPVLPPCVLRRLLAVGEVVFC